MNSLQIIALTLLVTYLGGGFCIALFSTRPWDPPVRYVQRKDIVLDRFCALGIVLYLTVFWLPEMVNACREDRS